jgi:predicted acetyltransferase
MNTKNFLRLGVPLSEAARLAGLTELAPTDLKMILKELGAGDARFRGTSFGRGECDLQTFLQQCRDEEDGQKIPADKVPQSTFGLVNEHNRVVGIVRVRHRLNERLLQYGGNIGYYIRPSERGKGYGKQVLQLALRQLRQLGATRALLTVHPDNTASAKIVLANGGVPDGQGKDPLSVEIADRYWIEL